MSGADPIVVGRAMPRIGRVSALDRFKIAVTWSAGERIGRTDVVDLGPMLFTVRMYGPLRVDREVFADVRVAAHGSAIAWGDAEAIDMSAAAIEELAQQTMNSADFARFLRRHHLTFDMAAAQLGISRRLVAYYAGGRAIPRPVALACAYLDLTLSGRLQAAS